MMAALATAAITLGEVFGAAAGSLAGMKIDDLVVDSRQVKPGTGFVALPGSHGHGLDYLDDARARGATAIIYEPLEDQPRVDAPAIEIPGLSSQLGQIAKAFFGRPAAPLKLAGVTGTNGKSTVAHLIAQAHTLRGIDCGYLGTLGYGVPPNLTAQTLTTPDCLSLHRTLRSLAVDYVALEVSSHALAQDRIAGLEFDTAVFTNLSQDHLDYHGTFDKYRDAKASLFGLGSLRNAVFFVDDPAASVIAKRLGPEVTRIDVSMENNADIRGRLLTSDLYGIQLEVQGPGGLAIIKSSLVGDFNAENLLLAIGVLLAWDISLTDACDALGRCASLPGRMQVFGGDHEAPWVIVDYAHTPAALARVLENLQRAATSELWCVFGCGGQRDSGKRAAMGSAAARIANHIVLTDDNPREEDPDAIIADIRSGIPSHPHVWVEHDRALAISDAVCRARVGDIVLIAGKGHERTQSIASGEREFSDDLVVEQALEART
ncbi:MAG: UDP-N-acetylmuramoyl-L-alanyl-D-glutamate--2,6-diaminopimelate ligase [Candidatus Rariloculaceae bacterium]